MHYSNSRNGAVKLQLCSGQRDDNERRLGIRRMEKKNFLTDQELKIEQACKYAQMRVTPKLRIWQNPVHSHTQNNPKALEERAAHVEVAP